eukprot:UN10641
MTSHALKDEVEVLSDQIGVLGWPNGGGNYGKKGNQNFASLNNDNNPLQSPSSPHNIISPIGINDTNNSGNDPSVMLHNSMIFSNTFDTQNNNNNNNNDHIAMSIANLTLTHNNTNTNHHNLQHGPSFLTSLSHNNSILQ